MMKGIPLGYFPSLSPHDGSVPFCQSSDLFRQRSTVGALLEKDVSIHEKLEDSDSHRYNAIIAMIYVKDILGSSPEPAGQNRLGLWRRLSKSDPVKSQQSP